MKFVFATLLIAASTVDLMLCLPESPLSGLSFKTKIRVSKGTLILGLIGLAGLLV